MLANRVRGRPDVANCEASVSGPRTAAPTTNHWMEVDQMTRCSR